MEDVLFSDLGNVTSCENKKGLLVKDLEISSDSKLRTFIAQQKITFIVYKIEEGIHFEQLIRQRIPTIVYGAEFHSKNDHGHQSNSGLDKPLVELMKQKGVVYGFCISDIKTALNTSKYRTIIPRIHQNIMLLEKYSCPYKVFSGERVVPAHEREQFLRAFTTKYL